ncbi:hypothetical protein ALC57_05227 [Trachymyrmex cornetzi]|uniref:Uncharacterized protein n=1 Tax=Trachymyrmex cornetzi TaxID=471704 RepID=A0A151JB78_9HYME|nr:hypothetical protein ALC57_05227 [Trachymyrmex cornetzi]
MSNFVPGNYDLRTALIFCYPLKKTAAETFFSTIEQRLNFHMHNKHTTHNLQVKDKYFTIPYVKSISESFLPISSISEHKSDIRRNTGSPTVITDHRINLDHNFKWDNVKILDCESSYNKRLVSEMVHIKRQKQGLNKMNDTESLPDFYSQIIQSLSPS